jgi:hypothetical protein
MDRTNQPAPDAPARKGDARMYLGLAVLLYAAALGLSVGLVWQGRVELGVGGVLLVLTLMPVAMIMIRRMTQGMDRALLDRVEQLSRDVRLLAEQSALSEEARRIIHREKEREILRRAIDEDIEAGQFDAALVLVRELAERFGFRADAEEYRRRIDRIREETIEREITDAIGVLDGLILQRRWNDALVQAARLQRLYPYSPRVEPLRERVEQARIAYKKDLERRFLLAAQEDRTDDALALLRELDAYLTPTEAEPLRELARGVIGKARLNLGAQFKLAVQDRRWAEAARVGESILNQFPNTRMAAEVRELLDGIRARANSTA